MEREGKGKIFSFHIAKYFPRDILYVCRYGSSVER